MDTYDWGIGQWLAAVVASMTLIGGCVGGCGTITNNWEISQGERTGMINKVSKKGWFWKTYEGQMALEGIASGGQSVGANVWEFSLDNSKAHGENIDDLAVQMRQYMDASAKVKVKYVEMGKTWPWRSGSDYLIQSISPVVVPGRNDITSKLGDNTDSVYQLMPGSKEVTIDGRRYFLRHKDGKLKVTELKEVE